MTIAEKIKKTRKAKGILQKELAKKCGTTVATVCRWEKGEREPGRAKIAALCDIIGVSADYLVREEIESQEEKRPEIYRALTEMNAHIAEISIAVGEIAQATLRKGDEDDG